MVSSAGCKILQQTQDPLEGTPLTGEILLERAIVTSKLFNFKNRLTKTLPGRKWHHSVALALGTLVSLTGCRAGLGGQQPAIVFTKIPPTDVGGPDKLDRIEGHVIGAGPDERIVLFAKSVQWWVQPATGDAYTKIQPDSSWANETHLGGEYAALLVGPGYHPPATLDELPAVGAEVLAVAVTKGTGPPAGMSKTLQFSGYEWNVRTMSSDRGGTTNYYGLDNVWTDEHGALHLRITKSGGQWTCAEVNLTRSLGYGLYRFVVRETSSLEPAVVFGMFTWDDKGEGQNHREMDVEMSRWGDSHSKNAQYVVQPYYVPANVARFTVPRGSLVHTFRWKPGSVLFQTRRGAADGSGNLAEHVFTSGVPTPGNERVHLNLYVYGGAASPPENEGEVVIEKFEYLP